MTEPIIQVEGEIPDNLSTDKVVLRTKRPRGRDRGSNQNGVLFSRPKSEFFSPSGISTLDIRTRLRITEAELAIVQREVSDLLAERNVLEASARQHEESWRFTIQELGRVVEQREELQRRLEKLEQAIAAAHHHAPVDGKGKRKTNKASFEQIKLALETQTRVSESLERERDRAYDDFEMAQVQLHTMMSQYQDLADSCSEVARERDKAKAEVQLLREELHRYEPDSDGLSSGRNSLRKMDGVSGSGGSLTSLGGNSTGDPDENPCQDPQILGLQLKALKDEKERMQSRYEQTIKRAEQYQKQLFRAEEDRRQALATSEALTALWQKKFEKAQNENYDLRQELLSAQDRISHLHERLAMVRLQSRGTTPSRPSPPDADPNQSDSYYEIYGRHSPVKSFSSSGSATMNDYTGYTGRSSTGNPVQRTGSFSLHTGSLSQATGYNLAQARGYLTQTSSLNSPQMFMSQSNTSPDLSSINRSISRTSSLKSTNELISPANASGGHLLWRQRVNEIHDGNHSTDDEGSWI